MSTVQQQADDIFNFNREFTVCYKAHHMRFDPKADSWSVPTCKRTGLKCCVDTCRKVWNDRKAEKQP